MNNNHFNGKFIVFEGLDVSGKSTQAKLLKDFLEDKGKSVVLTKEPTVDSVAGKKIKNVLEKKEKINPKDLQKLFTQDRQEHLENLIIPALSSNKIVISDRYFYSTFAYGVSDGLDLEWMINLNHNFLQPDLTFLLRVSPFLCISRITKRGIPSTLFEKEQKLEQVWKTYEILPKRFNDIIVIDGEMSINEVAEEIRDIVQRKIKL